jgi:hypothetical protein
MVNFEQWDQLLHQYVDSQGKVNYRAWKAESAAALKQWLDEIARLFHVNLPEMEPNQQFAFWLNLYNALVIDQVLDRYPLDSIRPSFLGIPNWVTFLQFFQRKVIKINNQFYNLNQIEHDTIRPQFRDPRIHFALVCAANGCPLLRNEAYQTERVQQQLEEDAQRFINNPQKVRYEPPFLYCSQIFKWYEKDFRFYHPSVSAYIQQYLSPGLPDSILSELKIRYLNYDWGLNQRTSS